MDVKSVDNPIPGLAQERPREKIVIRNDPKPEQVFPLDEFLRLERPDELHLGCLVIKSGETSKPVPTMYGKRAFVEPADVSSLRIMGRDSGGRDYLVDPRRDQDLQKFIEDAVKKSNERLIAQPGKTFAEVARQLVHDSVRYDEEGAFAISDQPGARLGMYLRENTVVCSQLAQLLRLILMQKEYLTNTIYFQYPNYRDKSGKPVLNNGHVAILSKEDELAPLMLHDPTWNFSLPFDQAVDEYANRLGGKVDIIDPNNKRRRYHIR